MKALFNFSQDTISQRSLSFMGLRVLKTKVDVISYYENLSKKVSKWKKEGGTPLTLTEKILLAHLD